MMFVRLRRRERAMAFGRYCRRRAASTIRARVDSDTPTLDEVPLSATETAIRLTPTRSAMSFMVAGRGFNFRPSLYRRDLPINECRHGNKVDRVCQCP